MTELTKKRPEFRNINAFKDLTTYRLPPAGWVSILHRASGGLMFILLPLIVWLFDTSVSSEISFERFSGAFSAGLGFVPGLVLQAGGAGPHLGLPAPPHCRRAPPVHGRAPRG